MDHSYSARLASRSSVARSMSAVVAWARGMHLLIHELCPVVGERYTAGDFLCHLNIFEGDDDDDGTYLRVRPSLCVPVVS